MSLQLIGLLLLPEMIFILSLLLFHILQQDFLQLVYPASKIIGRVLNKNYKTVQSGEWTLSITRVKFPSLFVASTRECKPFPTMKI